MANTFVKGDVVRLRSGGDPMTVVATGAACQYPNFGEDSVTLVSCEAETRTLKWATLPCFVLEKVKG